MSKKAATRSRASSAEGPAASREGAPAPAERTEAAAATDAPDDGPPPETPRPREDATPVRGIAMPPRDEDDDPDALAAALDCHARQVAALEAEPGSGHPGLRAHVEGLCVAAAEAIAALEPLPADDAPVIDDGAEPLDLSVDVGAPGDAQAPAVDDDADVDAFAAAHASDR